MEKPEQGTALFVPGERDRDMVIALHPMVGADGTFCLCLDISNQVLPAEVEAGVLLEDHRFAVAPVAPHRFCPIKNG
jgi:hypothetical protein